MCAMAIPGLGTTTDVHIFTLCTPTMLSFSWHAMLGSLQPCTHCYSAVLVSHTNHEHGNASDMACARPKLCYQSPRMGQQIIINGSVDAMTNTICLRPLYLSPVSPPLPDRRPSLCDSVCWVRRWQACRSWWCMVSRDWQHMHIMLRRWEPRMTRSTPSCR